MAKGKTEEVKNDKLSFLVDFNKATKGMPGVSTSAPPPKFWLDTGNYVTNKILSGTYNKGYASGRAACLAGPSGAGKSFLVGNAIKSALSGPDDIEWGTLVVDSENALDEDYLTKIGADVVGNPLYNYRGVATISDTVNVVSKLIRSYKDRESEMPFLIAIDSLDQLMTTSEYEAYEKKGEMSGDQGQHAKQIKAMLKRFVNDIKGTNIVLLCVKQVYQEQDKIAALNNPWRLTESTRFAFSQIGMVTKLALKDKTTNIFEGITLKLKGDKTRFTKPFQQCRIDVPYDAGIDRYSGILDAAVSLGIVEENGSWYNYGDLKFQKKGFDNYKQEVYQKVLEKDTAILNVAIEDEEDLSEAITAKEAEKLRKSRGEFDPGINDEADLSS